MKLLKIFLFIIINGFSPLISGAECPIDSVFDSMKIPRIDAIPRNLAEIDSLDAVVPDDDFVSQNLIQMKNYTNNRYQQGRRYRGRGYYTDSDKTYFFYDLEDTFGLYDIYVCLFDNHCRFPVTLQLFRSWFGSPLMDFSNSESLGLKIQNDLNSPSRCKNAFQALDSIGLPRLSSLPESISEISALQPVALSSEYVFTNLVQLQNSVETAEMGELSYRGLGYCKQDSLIFLIYDHVDCNQSRDVFLCVSDKHLRYPETLHIYKELWQTVPSDETSSDSLQLSVPLTFSIDGETATLEYSLITGLPWIAMCSEDYGR